MKATPSFRRRRKAIASLAIVAAIVTATLLALSGHHSAQSAGDHIRPTASTNVFRLTGQVRNKAGEPLLAATLCAYGTDVANRLDRECATTDDNGSYLINLRRGPYSITASANNHTSATTALMIDAHDEQLDFSLDSHEPTIAGIVKSASGERVAQARIAVYQGSTVVTNVVANRDGVFSAWTPTGSLSIHAEAETFGPTTVHTVAPTVDITITLYPGNAISGQVLLEDSLQPVPNVRIVATSRADRVITETRDAVAQSDGNGRFHFADLAAGMWFLTVADQHTWGTTPMPIEVTLGEANDGITLLVRPAGEVMGRLVIGENEQPCTEGQMQLISAVAIAHAAADHGRMAAADIAANPSLTAKVGANGAVQFPAVPYGDYRIAPMCNEHRLTSGPTTLEVHSEHTGELRWNFELAASITVAVTDELGRPIPQAAVALTPTDTQKLSPEQLMIMSRAGVTGTDGSYRFGGLTVGHYQVRARYAALNNNAGVSQNVELSSKSDTPVTLTLPGANMIRIHAHTASNAPVGRMLFCAISPSGARYEGRYDGDGRFFIGPVANDRYRVYAYDNKNDKITLNGGSEVLANRGQPIDLDFLYESPTAHLEGRVLDGTGQPLAETLVRAVSATLDESDERYSSIQTDLYGAQELMTDRNGYFRIDGLNARSTYDVYIDHRSGLQDVRRGVRPDAFVEIALPSAAGIVGRVTDTSGKPIDAFDVVVQNVDDGKSRSRSMSYREGQFKMENLLPGRLHISIFDQSGESAYESDAQLSPGQTLDIGRLTLTKIRASE
jgi:protocatechuate 3,4-dioxygenase beta subunit